ncbi:MAG: hypothetical protein HY748_11245 [Elusimicrobia bacterium]|nr:hypothetical protein [Elusimicrobiota bacterium]
MPAGNPADDAARPAPAGRPRAALFLALASLWLCLEYFILGPFSYVQTLETGDSYIPRHLAVASGSFVPRTSLWLPWLACGTDRLSIDFSFFHASSLLFGLLPGWLAYQAVIVLQIFLCAYFTYRLARDRLGIGELPAVFAGIAAGFFIDSPVIYQSGFSLLPLMLWSLEKIHERRGGAAWGLALGLGLLNASCSSIVYSLPFTLVAGAVWFSVVRRSASPRFWALFLVFCLVSTLPHLRSAWAAALNSDFSHRVSWASQALPVSGWMDLAGSLLRQHGPLLALAAAGLAFGRRDDRVLWGLLAGLLANVACALGLDGLRASFAGHLGFLKGFQFARLHMLSTLFAVLCAARGLDLLSARGRVFRAAMLVLACLSLPGKATRLAEWYFQGGYTANYGSPVLKELASRREEPFRVASFTHGLHPGYANAYGLETVDGYVGIYPKAYQRYWSKVIEPLTAQDRRFDEYFNAWGNRIYLFFESVDMFREGIEFSRYYRLPLLSLANARYVISRHPLLDKDLVPVAPVPPWPWNDRKERVLLRLKENFTGKTHLFVYENKTALPRAFLVGQARFFPEGEDLMKALSSADGRTLRDTVFLDDRFLGAVGRGPFSRGAVSFVEYRADRITLRLAAAGPALLVVSNNYSPFWTCEVDGASKTIMPADGAFWAVRVEAPAGQVVFRYSPPYRL